LTRGAESKKLPGAAAGRFMPPNRCPPTIRYRKQCELNFDAASRRQQRRRRRKNAASEVAEVIAGYLLTGEVRNAVNLPYLDAKTYEQVKPYLPLGAALGNCWRSSRRRAPTAFTSPMAPRAEIADTDPVTRSIFARFLESSAVKDVTRQRPLRRREHRHQPLRKEIDEQVTFNEWRTCRFSQRKKNWFRRAGTFFGSPNIPASCGCSHAGGNSHQRHLLLTQHKDRPASLAISACCSPNTSQHSPT